MTGKELSERDRCDIAAVFSTREGRRVIARLLHECGVYCLSLNVAFSEQSHATAYREGRRAIGLELLKWISEADETAIAKLFEADKEREIDEWTKQD